jgi:hypothetical protein
MTDISLNDDQATAILTEGLNRNLYEGPIPSDSADKMKDAEDLTKAAQLAFNNGNRSDNVQTILFISQVDQKPPLPEEQVSEAPMAETAPEVTNNIHNGIDLSTLSDGVIDGLIVGLDKYPNSEQVEEDRKAYLAEKERRNEKAGKSQDEPQGTTAQAPEEKAGEAAPEDSPAQTEVGSQLPGEAGDQERAGGEGTASGPGDVEQQNSAQGEDAGAFARAQTPETSPEGKQIKAKAPKEDGSRLELEEQLTFDILKAHEADITKINNLTVDQIKFMLENPDGSGDKKVPITDGEAEAAAVTNAEVKAVTGISAQESSPERVVSKEDLGIKVEEIPAQKAAEEIDRESLEAQLTGPTLKAYGQGRKSVPGLGINELRFMVEHPDGKVYPAELEAARALDNLDSESPADRLKAVEKINDLKKYAEGGLVENPNIKLNNSETLFLVESETIIKGPPIEEVNRSEISDIEDAEEVNKRDNIQRADKVFSEIDAEESRRRNRAMEIVAQEGMPIPPAYSDEQAPVFPVDVSKCSREELYSFHAEYHAYETRINYVLIEHEDRLNDCIHYKNYRENVVAKEVPFMGEDGKRNTNEFREAQVKGDPEVLELSNKEHEARKIVSGLKAFQKNFHLSCERLSRQISKYETERQDAPR